MNRIAITVMPHRNRAHWFVLKAECNAYERKHIRDSYRDLIVSKGVMRIYRSRHLKYVYRDLTVSKLNKSHKDVHISTQITLYLTLKRKEKSLYRLRFDNCSVRNRSRPWEPSITETAETILETIITFL